MTAYKGLAKPLSRSPFSCTLCPLYTARSPSSVISAHPVMYLAESDMGSLPGSLASKIWFCMAIESSEPTPTITSFKKCWCGMLDLHSLCLLMRTKRMAAMRARTTTETMKPTAMETISSEVLWAYATVGIWVMFCVVFGVVLVVGGFVGEVVVGGFVVVVVVVVVAVVVGFRVVVVGVVVVVVVVVEVVVVV